MPTINKQKNFSSGGSGVPATLLCELPGFKKVSDKIDGLDWPSVISVDGEEDICFFTGVQNSKYVSGLAKKESDTYKIFHNVEFAYDSQTCWLRCYTPSSSPSSDRLITIGYSDTPGYSESVYDILTFMVGKDVENNTVYGFGASHIRGLYCKETDMYVDLDFLLSDETPSGETPVHLSESAILTKAVNFCHPNVPEMRDLYTALWRPRMTTRTGEGQRFMIDGSLWGFSNTNLIASVPVLLDPALKI